MRLRLFVYGSKSAPYVVDWDAVPQVGELVDARVWGYWPAWRVIEVTVG